MLFETGNFIIQNNGSRFALIVDVKPDFLTLFWMDSQNQILFPTNRAALLVNNNKWKYVSV
jgi:hypothetical protein